MAECDSDLEEQDEQIIIHNSEQCTIINNGNKPEASKKRAFNSVVDDATDENGNHYSANCSPSKKAKHNHDEAEEKNSQLQQFVDDGDDQDDDDDDDDDDNTERNAEEEEEEEEEDSDLNDDDAADDDDLLRFDDVVNAEIQQVEFELQDMHEAYYHEVKDILGATDWDQKKLHVDLLADTVVKQEEIGGVLCVDQSVLGFITLLSFKKYAEHLSLAHIHRFLSNKLKVKTQKVFDHFFNGAFNVGLLLHERPLNTPLQLIPLIYESLRQDIAYATDKQRVSHLSDAEIALNKMDFVLLIVRYRWNPNVTAPTKKNKNKNKKGKKQKADQEEHAFEDILLPHYKNDRTKMKLVYEHMEHQLFVDQAEFQCDFERFDKVWNIVLIKMNHFHRIVQRIHDMFGSAM